MIGTMRFRIVLFGYNSEVWLHTTKHEKRMTAEQLSQSSSSTPRDAVGLASVLSDWSVEYSPKNQRDSQFVLRVESGSDVDMNEAGTYMCIC